MLVAPTTEAAFNTISQDLVPVACLSLTDVNFEFDSSFVRPDAVKVFAGLKALRDKHKNSRGEFPPLGVWGHADPVGDPEYNKQLSGRRAKAAYGILIHDVDMWMELHGRAFHGDDWKARNMAGRMRAAIGAPATKPLAAVVDEYLTLLCPEPVSKADFLGRGEDPKGKVDFQGCGEFNPLIILSKKDGVSLSKEERNAANTPDRRVVVFLFRAGSKPRVALWPCPRAHETTAGCRTRFFTDADRRLAPGDERREHREPQQGQDEATTDTDTFACRFYDRIARLSPCERLLRSYQLRLFDEEAVALPFAPFAVFHSTKVTVGRADANAIITVHDLLVPDTATVKWSTPEPGADESSRDPAPTDTFEFELEAFIDVPDEETDDDVVVQRLHNLGYNAGPELRDDIAEFQRDYKARLPPSTVSGTLDAPTRKLLQDVYNAADPQRKTFVNAEA
jgi:hypothetical protein